MKTEINLSVIDRLMDTELTDLMGVRDQLFDLTPTAITHFTVADTDLPSAQILASKELASAI